jgi:hypothetical protein
VAQSKAVGELADRRLGARGQSLERQQSLMLVWLDSELSCPYLAEV